MDYNKIYADIFKLSEYNSDNSVSYERAINFLKKVNQVISIDNITDIGSGKANLIKKIRDINELRIFSYDLECFYNINKFKNIEFNCLNLSNKKELSKIYDTHILFCLDVMEHIEEKYIDNILEIFSKKSPFCFLTIANHSDIINGNELHLIQKDNIFWDEKIKKYFNILEYETFYEKRLMCYSLQRTMETK